MADKVIVNCETGEVRRVKLTAQEEADAVARQQAAAIRKAAEEQKESERQASIAELRKTAEGQHVLKAVGLD